METASLMDFSPSINIQARAKAHFQKILLTTR
jgi:hypothetical protein